MPGRLLPRYHPFDQGRTLGLEDRIEMKVKDGSTAYILQGYIDRLTGCRAHLRDPRLQDRQLVPSQEDADQDRQLALYQLGVSSAGRTRIFKLVWHYLAADREIVSTRTAGDLQSARERQVLGQYPCRRGANPASAGGRSASSRLCEW